MNDKSIEMINGNQVGDLELVELDSLPATMQEFALRVDDLLPEEFEMYQLEGDESVYFAADGDDGERVVAEIRKTTEREAGNSDGNGPTVFLGITSDGDTPDTKMTFFSLEKAVDFGAKRIMKILNQDV